MCLAVPLKVISLKGGFALVESGGLKNKVNIQMLADNLKVGDYVMVHAGFAIAKIDCRAAKETLNLIDEIS